MSNALNQTLNSLTQMSVLASEKMNTLSQETNEVKKKQE